MSSVTPKPGGSSKPAKELPNEVRMLLAFGLMALILFATPVVYRRLGITPPEPSKPPAATSPAKTSPAPGSGPAESTPITPAPASAPVASASQRAANALAATLEEKWELDTPSYHVEFSNHGALVHSWTLKKFKDSANKPLEVVNQAGVAKAGYPFSFHFRGTQPSSPLNDGLWVAHPATDGLSIEYEFSDGHTAAKKTFAFQRDGYLVQFADEVSVDGQGLPHLIQWRGGIGDMAVANPSSHQDALRYDTENWLPMPRRRRRTARSVTTVLSPFLAWKTSILLSRSFFLLQGPRKPRCFPITSPRRSTNRSSRSPGSRWADRCATS
jgi:YidC/Oxa1 family membrane protein insertase